MMERPKRSKFPRRNAICYKVQQERRRKQVESQREINEIATMVKSKRRRSMNQLCKSSISEAVISMNSLPDLTRYHRQPSAQEQEEMSEEYVSLVDLAGTVSSELESALLRGAFSFDDTSKDVTTNTTMNTLSTTADMNEVTQQEEFMCRAA